MNKKNRHFSKKCHEIQLLIDGNIYLQPVSKPRVEIHLQRILEHPANYKNPQFLASFYESLLLNMRLQKPSHDYRIKMEK